jgi:hypothetical protein
MPTTMDAAPSYMDGFRLNRSGTKAAGNEPMTEPTLYIEQTRETPDPVMSVSNLSRLRTRRDSWIQQGAAGQRCNYKVTKQ